jgi:3-isopropylmalate/(R)-2-methylmalate dehydratase small subunit
MSVRARPLAPLVKARRFRDDAAFYTDKFMKAFTVHRGRVAPLDRVNVDTDQIIPKQFLKRIEKTGFGKFLFYDWRFVGEGKPNPDFVLNDPRYEGATLLVAGKNFGCGSSREHAVWALADYGFRAVISSSFADIFANNSTKNGFLTVRLSEEEVTELMRRAENVDNYQITVDLEKCEVSDDHGFSAKFSIEDFVRHCLLNGLDDIGLTLQHEEQIAAYEAHHPVPVALQGR